MNNRRKLLKISLIAAFILSVGWTFLGHVNRVLADTNVAIGNIEPLPNSADVYVDHDYANPTPTPVASSQPAMTNGVGDYDGMFNWLKIYVPVGQSATVTIQNGAGYCYNVNDMQDINSGGNPDVTWSLVDLSANETAIGGLGSYTQALDSLAGGAGCGNLSFPTIAANQGTPSVIIGHQNYRVFLFESQMTNCPTATPSCTTGVYKDFRVFAEPGANKNYSFSTAGPLVGFSRAVIASPGPQAPFGIDYSNLNNDYGTDTDWTFDTQFGTQCNESDPNAPITFYDMDNGLSNPQFLSANLYQDPRSDPTFTYAPPPINSWTAAQIGTLGQNHTVNTVNFNAQPDFRYKLYTNRVDWLNRYLLYATYDQFDASSSAGNCDDSTCTITSISLSSPQPVNTQYTITIKVTNSGTSGQTWNTNYQLRQTAGGTGGPYPLSSSVAPGGNATFNNVTMNSAVPTTINPVSYRMYNDLGEPFGQTCSTPLTWNIVIYSYPYIKAYGGDVSAGGAFQNADGSCDVNNSKMYIDPANNPGPSSQYFGGIRTYATPDATDGSPPKGSSVDFAAYALGLISPPGGTSPYGFYSDGVYPGTVATKTSQTFDFANQDPLGGLMAGLDTSSYAHCAPDYFDSTMESATTDQGPAPADKVTLDSQGGQQYYDQTDGNPLVIAGSLNKNKMPLTLYVKGNVYITNDIKYDAGGWGFDTDPTNSGFGTNDAPYFALIVKGNIFIDPSVSQLDGFYVAQPSKSDGSDGVIVTCAPGGTEANPAQIGQSCNSQLVFNGAVAAQHIHLLRSFGDASAVSTSEPGPYDLNSSYDAAEIFNFTPSIVLGQPDLNTQSSGIQNLNSLPPVF